MRRKPIGIHFASAAALRSIGNMLDRRGETKLLIAMHTDTLYIQIGVIQAVMQSNNQR